MTDPITAPTYLPIAGADPKPWWQSRRVLGSLAVIVAQGLAFAGLQVDAGLLTEMALQAVSLVGGAVALFGRIKASQPIR